MLATIVLFTEERLRAFVASHCANYSGLHSWPHVACYNIIVLFAVHMHFLEERLRAFVASRCSLGVVVQCFFNDVPILLACIRGPTLLATI